MPETPPESGRVWDGRGVYVISKPIMSCAESWMVCITLNTDGNHLCPISEVSYPLIMANVFFQDTACGAIPFQLLSTTMRQSSPYCGTHRVELKTDFSHIFLLFGSFPTQENYIKSFFSLQLWRGLLYVPLTGCNH